MTRPDITPFVDVLEDWLRDNALDVELLQRIDQANYPVRFRINWDGIAIEVSALALRSE